MKRLLQTPARLKIARFFLDNPTSIDTPRGISAWTNVAITDARAILEDMARSGILKAYRTSSTVGYSLSESRQVLRSLERAVRKHAP